MFARLLSPETALWTIAAAGRVEGCLVRDQGCWRLGRPVELQSLAS
jgi:hypothetical protein